MKARKPPVKSGEIKRRSAKTYINKNSSKPAVKKVAVKKSVPSKEIETEAALTKIKKVPKGKKPPQEFYVGEITHYFPKISVVVVKVEEHPILIADTILVKGSADFSQKVQSLQVESKDVRFARKGELVGLQVIQPAKPGDKVYKIKK